MTIPELLEFILLPCIAWLLLNSNKTTKSISRIEAQLELLMSGKIRTKKNEPESNS